MKPFVKHSIGFGLSICMLTFLTLTTPLTSGAQSSSPEVDEATSSTSPISIQTVTNDKELNIEVAQTVFTPDTQDEIISETIFIPETIPETIINSETEVAPVVTPEMNEQPVSTEMPVVTPKPVETASPNATMSATAKPAATAKPIATAQKVETAKPKATAKVTATAKPVRTAKPTATVKPQQSYDSVSKVTIADDKVASPVNLDKKVPENLKEAYTAVKNAFSKPASKKTITFLTPITLTELRDVIYYVRNYNPQLFYIDFTQYTYGFTNGKITSVTLNGMASANQQSTFEAAAKEIIAEANKKANLFEREVYVYDWLVKHVQYDNSTAYSDTAYGAIVDGRAGCEGYARAFQYLMNQIGVETVLITGRTDENHMWNMVKLYGEYYFVDVTSDDPVPNVTIKDGQEYKINRACLNISAKVLKQTHKIDEKGSRGNDGLLKNPDLQNCTATRYQYYNVKGLSVSNMSELKYVLNENKSLPNVEVFFEGTMPELDEIVETFEEFLEDQYPEGYYYSTTAETSHVYQRNVVRFIWMPR